MDHSIPPSTYCPHSFPTESKVWCSMKNAKITIGLTYAVVPILCIPLYLSFSIQADQMPVPAGFANETAYYVSHSLSSAYPCLSVSSTRKADVQPFHSLSTKSVLRADSVLKA